MPPLGKYATPIIACDPAVPGTAICHNPGRCYMCDFAARYEVRVYLTDQSKALGSVFEANPSQIDKMAQTMSLYGFPLCLCKAFSPKIMTAEEVKCPCPEARKDIEETGKCHCGIFRKKEHEEVPLFFQGLVERAKEANNASE